MSSRHDVEARRAGAREDKLERVLAAVPVTERRLQLARISTPVLERGHGRPLVLLHGPDEFAAGWVEVLIEPHRPPRRPNPRPRQLMRTA